MFLRMHLRSDTFQKATTCSRKRLRSHTCIECISGLKEIFSLALTEIYTQLVTKLHDCVCVCVCVCVYERERGEKENVKEQC